MSTEITLASVVKKYGGLIQTGPFGSQLHQSDYSAKGIPVVMPKDICNRSIDETSVARVPEDIADKLSRHILKQNNIVLPRRGEIRKCALVSEKQEGYLCGTGCLKIELPEEKLFPKFMSYYLSLPRVGEWLERNATGTTMLNLSASIVGGLLVPKNIDLITQKKIASTLSAYDDLIENNRRRIHLLEESARLLYKEWFVRLRFPGHEQVEIVDGVPEGWERKPLIEVASLTMGQSPKSEFYNEVGDGLPFHQGVTNYGERFVTHKIYSTKTTRIAQSGDILCSVRAPVGRLNYTLDKIILGRGLCAISSKSGNQSFLFYQLKNYFFKENIIGSGAIYAAVTKKDMTNLRLSVPSTHVIQSFEEKSIPIDKQIQTLSEQNQKLAQARDLLLPRLMNGEIEI